MAIESVARKMVDSNAAQLGGKRAAKARLQVSRQQAELAARELIKKKKRNELVKVASRTVSEEQRSLMKSSVEKAKAASIEAWGHGSLPVAQASYTWAQFHRRAGNSEAACEELTVVLHILREVVAPLCPAVCAVARQLGQIFSACELHRDAAAKFSLAARCAEADDNDRLAVVLWQQAAAELTKAGNGSWETDQLIGAREAVVNTLRRIANEKGSTKPGCAPPLAENQVSALRELGLLLIKANEVERARSAFASAKTLLLTGSRLSQLTPAKRRLVGKLNHLIASTKATQDLRRITTEVEEGQLGPRGASDATNGDAKVRSDETNNNDDDNDNDNDNDDDDDDLAWLKDD